MFWNFSVLIFFALNSGGILKSYAGPPRLLLSGGQNSVAGDIPWIATIRNDKGVAICGATIFLENFLLSAAHCFDDYFSNRQAPGINKWTVILGQYDRSIIDETTVIEPIDKIFLHPDYNDMTLVNDIAIIKINTIKWNKFIKPARISDNSFSELKTATVAGWGFGFFVDKYDLPHILQFAEVPIYTNSECYEIFRQYMAYNPIRIHISQLCAGKHGIFTQRGDSGGGLYAQVDGNWTVGGIVSYNLRDGKPDGKIPGIYTRVSSYNDWIHETCLHMK